MGNALAPHAGWDNRQHAHVSLTINCATFVVCESASNKTDSVTLAHHALSPATDPKSCRSTSVVWYLTGTSSAHTPPGAVTRRHSLSTTSRSYACSKL